MSAPDPLERFVVIARNPPDDLQALVRDGVDPALEFENDVAWRAFEILLGPPAQPDSADHDGSVHHWGVYRKLTALIVSGIGGSVAIQRAGSGPQSLLTNRPGGE